MRSHPLQSLIFFPSSSLVPPLPNQLQRTAAASTAGFRGCYPCRSCAALLCECVCLLSCNNGHSPRLHKCAIVPSTRWTRLRPSHSLTAGSTQLHSNLYLQIFFFFNSSNLDRHSHTHAHAHTLSFCSQPQHNFLCPALSDGVVPTVTVLWGRTNVFHPCF